MFFSFLFILNTNDIVLAKNKQKSSKKCKGARIEVTCPKAKVIKNPNKAKYTKEQIQKKIEENNKGYIYKK
jgi:hypothetical protein